jgi:hypothetical protein
MIHIWKNAQSANLMLGQSARASSAGRSILVKFAAIVAALFPLVAPSIARADYWTEWVSEENPPAICSSGHLIGGIRCRGSYCDDLSLYCVNANIQSVGRTYWSRNFSEESPSYFTCPGREYVTGIDCSGRYCDNVALFCTDIVNPVPANADCNWTGWISEEGGGTLIFPRGYYMDGAQCSGRYCDNMRFHICRV